MAKGTKFGTVHSNTNLGLIQQRVKVSPAEPKTSFVDVPGANGSKDLTEALGVGVKYADREIEWTFALYPGADWYAKQAQVSNAINGLACHIVLDDDPDWYYDGRVMVVEHTSDRLLRQITVRAVCRPYKLSNYPTTTMRQDLTENYKNLVLNIGAMPLIPEITVEQETTLKWGDLVVDVNEGTHSLPALLMSGNQIIKAKLPEGETGGSITIKWREGSL